MAYDPDIHEDPYAFKPERWLSREDGGEGRSPLPHTYTFGFGRRYAFHLYTYLARLGLDSMSFTERAWGRSGQSIW